MEVQIMTRVALYARYSDDKQSPFSIEDQFRICREYAERQGWQMVQTFQDAGISGSTVILRPGFQALLQAALAGRFDIVLAEALDRLSRDQEDIAAAYKRLGFAGVRIVTLADGEINELHVGLKGTMNALYLKDLGAKTHRGIRGRVENGKVGCGNAYGYRVIRALDASGRPVTGEREIIPEQAEVIRRIFRDYVAGLGPQQIAIALNREGIPSPSGGRWVDSSIRGNPQLGSGILNNEFYIGEMIWNRQHRVKNPDTGRRVLRMNPESAWIHVKAPHLRIIEDDLWHAARARQAVLAKTYEKVIAASKTRSLGAALNATHRPKTLLSGLLVCGVCGGSVAKRGQGRYACVAHMMGSGCANTRTVRRQELEERVLNGLKVKLMATQATAEALAGYAEETARLNQGRDARQSADKARLETVERAIKGLVSAIEDGGYSRPLMTRLKDLEAEADGLTQRLTESPANDAEPIPTDFIDRYTRQIADLAETLNAPDTSAQAADVLRSLIDRIELTPGEKRGEVHGVLYGDLGAIIDWTAARKSAKGSGNGYQSPLLSVPVQTRACPEGRALRAIGALAPSGAYAPDSSILGTSPRKAGMGESDEKISSSVYSPTSNPRRTKNGGFA
jgi:DNA invertase Pin-like site-specific DNA recombinase